MSAPRSLDEVASTMVTPPSISPFSSTCTRVLKKAVSFRQEVKIHDGIQARQANFERLIARFFASGVELSELEIFDICDWDEQASAELLQDTADLITRLEQRNKLVEMGLETDAFVPVLPRGGGKAFRVFAQDHLEVLKCLDVVIQSAVSRLRAEKEDAVCGRGTSSWFQASKRTRRMANCT